MIAQFSLDGEQVPIVGNLQRWRQAEPLLSSPGTVLPPVDKKGANA